MPKSKLQRVRSLLWKMLHQQRAAGHKQAAHNIKAAIDAIQDKPDVKPTRILYPGVRAAREQSQNGGLPGNPSASFPTPPGGWCLMAVRLCYNIAAKARRAIDAWHAAEHKHHTSDPMAPKRGYPVFFAPNHVAIAAGGGAVWSTDVDRLDRFDKVSIRDLERMWGLTMLGWTEDLNGEPVPAEVEL